jgi:hypothetical protein
MQKMQQNKKKRIPIIDLVKPTITLDRIYHFSVSHLPKYALKQSCILCFHNFIPE